MVVSVEYRVAPEHPHPASIEDVYAGLLWTAGHAEEIGADPERIVVAGSSAGGGLCAALTLLTRDRKGPQPIGGTGCAGSSGSDRTAHYGGVKELVGRLSALDPDAGAAVRVIAYFDRLAQSRAGVEALVRGAAVLAGCPARLLDAQRRVNVRVEADGRRCDTDLPPDPAWLSAALTPGGAAALWLERADAAAGVVDAVILERAAGVMRHVLDRTRGRAPADDPALTETVLDATAPERARLHAARCLGLDTAVRARVLASSTAHPASSPHPRAQDRPPDGPTSPLRPRTPNFPAAASASGPPSPCSTCPVPGPPPAPPCGLPPRAPHRTPARASCTPTSGGIACLAELVAPGAEPPPDVHVLEAAAAAAPWLLATLHAVAWTASLRAAAAAAAAEINVHHSTLQDRLSHAEGLLGWPVRTPQGRLRLQLALTMRRLARKTGG